MWWRSAVTYEVYPRSFADGNGDGEGDLPGLTSRLPYLADLGVDALWIAPWYPSPLADGGYDITNYRNIHPLYGTLSDAEQLLEAATAHGIRILIDLVANHTSSEHPWFREALAAEPDDAARRRYHFRPGRGENGQLPPNNWISAFGGPAWTRATDADGMPGQWYLHTFAPQQPDLNWDCDEVVAEFDSILRFWLDRGIAGFRIDAVPAMVKVPDLPDATYDEDLRFAPAEWVDNPHWDVDGVHDILRSWRRTLDEYDGERVFVAEAIVNGPQRLANYLRPDELQTAFNFAFLHAKWEAGELRRVIDDTLAALAPIGAPASWVMSSHDEVRHRTRLGRGDVGLRRARAAILLMLGLPGGVYLYQGEELGLPEIEDLPGHVLRDPVFAQSGGAVRGRDGCRVPLPWRGDEPPFGFAPEGVETWLPQPPGWGELTVAAQSDRSESMLHHYRTALALRRELADSLNDQLQWLSSPDNVLAFARGTKFQCVVNLSEQPYELPADPIIASASVLPGRLLPPDSAAWLIGR
jgi:alpha-glucosidase